MNTRVKTTEQRAIASSGGGGPWTSSSMESSGARRPARLEVVRPGARASVRASASRTGSGNSQWESQLPPLQAKPVELTRLPDGRLALTSQSTEGVAKPLELPRQGPATGVGTVPAGKVTALRPLRARHFAHTTGATTLRRKRQLGLTWKQEIRLKRGFVALLGAIWLFAYTRPTLEKATMASVPSFAAVPSSGYAHYRVPEAWDLPVVWMARVDGSMLAVVDSSWRELSAKEKLVVIRKLVAIGEKPEEILVMNNQSELMAEVYEDKYHIYQ